MAELRNRFGLFVEIRKQPGSGPERVRQWVLLPNVSSSRFTLYNRFSTNTFTHLPNITASDINYDVEYYVTTMGYRLTHLNVFEVHVDDDWSSDPEKFVAKALGTH